GSIVMVIATIVTLTLDIQKVITLISSFTPVLLGLVIIITIYSLVTFDFANANIQEAVDTSNRGASHWVLGAFLYVSYNLAAGAAMLTVMGGTEKNEKVAGMGGIIGGLGLGLLILLI